MSALFSRVSNSAPTATGTAKLTLLQVVAPANHRLNVRGLNIGFQGTTNTDKPIFVTLTQQTTAGTFTGSVTPVKAHSGDAETLQVTGFEVATSEPAGSSTVFETTVHPQGSHNEQFSFVLPKEVAGAGRLGVCVTATTSVMAIAGLDVEE